MVSNSKHLPRLSNLYLQQYHTSSQCFHSRPQAQVFHWRWYLCLCCGFEVMTEELKVEECVVWDTVVLILVGIYVFLALFWAYVRQPDNHWDTLMPFASINSTNPRTNPWNFREKILRIWGVEKLFFWVGHFDFFFWFFFFFCFLPMKISPNLYGRMDG